jgi:hypothetical protein
MGLCARAGAAASKAPKAAPSSERGVRIKSSPEKVGTNLAAVSDEFCQVAVSVQHGVRFAKQPARQSGPKRFV